MLPFISNIILLFSTLIVLLYHAPYLKYRWFFAVWLKLFPYLSSITIVGCLWVLVWPTLRRQRIRMAIATLLLITCWAPILSWVELPNLGPTPKNLDGNGWRIGSQTHHHGTAIEAQWSRGYSHLRS